MHKLNEIQILIEEALGRAGFIKEPHELYEPVEYAMSQGGKRMRPALVLISCEMFGGDIEKALYPALGIEIFHNFTLLHDDIMDDAPIRRGQPTVYRKWDANTAILSGDVMMVLANKYISQAEPAVLKDVIDIFNRAAAEVCEGQQYDMNFEKASNVSISDYLKMIRLKTAVLLAASLEIGATIAGADTENVKKIYSFGENTGMAFQLQDDLLDVFGKEKKFGKQTGGDIVTNKKTFLYLKAMELADAYDLNVLKNYFSANDFDNEIKINTVKDIYIKLKIKEHTEREISRYYSLASDNIESINVPEARKYELRGLAKKLLRRDY